MSRGWGVPNGRGGTGKGSRCRGYSEPWRATAALGRVPAGTSVYRGGPRGRRPILGAILRAPGREPLTSGCSPRALSRVATYDIQPRESRTRADAATLGSVGREIEVESGRQGAFLLRAVPPGIAAPPGSCGVWAPGSGVGAGRPSQRAWSFRRAGDSVETPGAARRGIAKVIDGEQISGQVPPFAD